MVLNYRLLFKRKVEIGDKCFVVYNGFMRGYQEVVGVVYQDGFECEVTGEYWREGWYIQRSGKFHTIHPKPMKGFRGIRYTDALPIDPTGKDGED